MYRSDSTKQMKGKTPLRARREPGTGGSVPTKNTMGDGSEGASAKGAGLMSHGERCASASGHVMGKGS